MNTNLVATPDEIVNAGDVVPTVSPPQLAVKALLVPARSIFRPFPEKSATPDTALMLTVPPKVPVPVVRLKVMEREEEVTVFPAASSMVTTG